MASRYPCPCCGRLSFGGPPGSYELCPCGWEDDGLQLEFATTLEGGANKETLLEAQRTYPRNRGDEADPTWRPIDSSRDHFPNWGGNEPRPNDPLTLYYWRSNFWRR